MKNTNNKANNTLEGRSATAGVILLILSVVINNIDYNEIVLLTGVILLVFFFSSSSLVVDLMIRVAPAPLACPPVPSSEVFYGTTVVLVVPLVPSSERCTWPVPACVPARGHQYLGTDPATRVVPERMQLQMQSLIKENPDPRPMGDNENTLIRYVIKLKGGVGRDSVYLSSISSSRERSTSAYNATDKLH
jgi:hypothetical protein